MNANQEAFKSLPAVDKLLSLPEVILLISNYGKELVLFSIRNALIHYRSIINKSTLAPTSEDILNKAKNIIQTISCKSLKKVFNATGIIIHTNLGRAPYAECLILESIEVLKGYNNLEFNLQNGNRGNRNEHASELI